MSKEVVLVDVHHQELVELHMLVPLQGRAVAGPAQPLQVDAQTLRELQVGESGSAECWERAPKRPRKQGQQGVWCGLTFPSFNCLTKVVLWCSTFSPFSVPLASIWNKRNNIHRLKFLKGHLWRAAHQVGVYTCTQLALYYLLK